LQVEKPLRESPPIGVSLPVWKADAYVTHLHELQGEDHVNIDLEEVEQVAGRMVLPASVWPEILLTLGPVYAMMYTPDPKFAANGARLLRRRSVVALASFKICEEIIRRNSPRPFFPSVRHLPLGDAALGVGFSDVSRPGKEGPQPGDDHYVGFWCVLPNRHVLHGHDPVDFQITNLKINRVENQRCRDYIQIPPVSKPGGL
jgi:hypothetical protein